MKVEFLSIPYGKNKHIEISIPQNRISGVIKPKTCNISDKKKLFENALTKPLDSPSLSEFLHDYKEILIIVNDTTRPTPTAGILGHLQPYLKDRVSTILIATGIHEQTNEKQNKIILGKYYNKYRKSLICHDCWKSPMRDIGFSKNGTHLLINNLVFNYKKIIVTGSVEPHYFAGYTGGRKAFMPGVAAYESIEQNHKFAMHPNSRLLSLKDNPVHQDMTDALKSIERYCDIFSIMTVLDSNNRLCAVTAGDINSSFEAAIKKCNQIYCVKIKEKADVVVAVCTHPMDSNLYQSQKGLESGRLALKKGGIIILVAPCYDGVGQEEFTNILRKTPDAKKLLSEINKNYLLGTHKAARIAEISTWAKIYCCTDLKNEELKGLFMIPKKNLQNAIQEALDITGPDSKALFIISANVVVPML